MAKKIPDHIKKKNARAKIEWLEYRELGSWKMKPYCEETVRRAASQLVEWARNDEDALVIDEWHLVRGIGSPTYDRWKKKYSFFQEAHDNAKYLIGLRREKGTIKGKYSDTAVNRTQPAYSRRLRESEAWRSSLRQKEAEKGAGKVNVEMTKIPNCPEVPPKPEGDS